MTDKDETAKDTASTGEGASNNRAINDTPEKVGQTPDQFYGGDDTRPDQAPAPKGHATKGMTPLGWSEASRLEDTAAQQERDRKDAEKRTAKETDDGD